MIPTKTTLKSARRNALVSDLPIRETVPEPTPKAQAKAANKLPRAEQMNNFKKDLQAKDSGNRPA